jgi:hypothetical protein
LLNNALCERSVNLKEKYNVKESSDSNLFTTVSIFAIDRPPFISDEIASPDTSNKVQLSEGQNSCDIRLVSQLRRVDPSLWICPFYCPKVAFFGVMI